MRVLFVNKLYPPDVGGGAELTLASIATGVRARGVEVCVVTTTRGSSRERDEVDGVPVVRLPLRNVYWHHDTTRRRQPLPMLWHALDVHNRPMARALGDEIRAFAPDLVSFHNLAGFSAAAWGAATRTGTPAIQVLHDYYHLCARSQLVRADRNCDQRCGACQVLRVGRGPLSRQLRGVVGISRSVLDAHLAEGLFRDVGIRTVIHNARDIPPGPPRDYPRRATRFGFIGTLGSWKGIELLLETFERVQREPEHSELRLSIAGTGERGYTTELRRRFEGPAVEFLGQRSVAAFFPTIDVLVVPSMWREPLGMVAVEALLAGVPVVGAARGGLPEIVRDGVNGLVFDPARPDDLERCLRALARPDGLVGELGARTIESAQSFGNLNRMIDAYLALYGQVAERRPS